MFLIVSRGYEGGRRPPGRPHTQGQHGRGCGIGCDNVATARAAKAAAAGRGALAAAWRPPGVAAADGGTVYIVWLLCTLPHNKWGGKQPSHLYKQPGRAAPGGVVRPGLLVKT